MSNRPDDACPKCGEALLYNEVDIGVGIQYSAPWCSDPACGWEPARQPWEESAEARPMTHATTCIARSFYIGLLIDLTLNKAVQDWCDNCQSWLNRRARVATVGLTDQERMGVALRLRERYPCTDVQELDAGPAAVISQDFEESHE